MSSLDRDSKILMGGSSADDNNSSDGGDSSKKSKRKVGGQGLRRFGTLENFKANIKVKSPETTIDQSTLETSEPQVTKPVASAQEVIPLKNEAKSIEVQVAPLVSTVVEVKTEPTTQPKLSEDASIAKTEAASTSLLVQKESVQSKSHVITSEIPRQPTINTTVILQESHVKTTDSTRHDHVNDHAKAHVQRGFQGSHLVDDSIIYNIHSLPKYHRVIVEFMFSKCSQTGTNKTSHIFTNEILGVTGMKSRTYEDALARLIEDKILTVIDVRKGRSGFRTFEIHSNIFAQLIQESRNPNKYHVNHHAEHHGFSPSKEVSKLNNNITNYTQTANVVIPKKFNFKDLDFTELASLHWTQVNSSIRKLAEEKFEKEEMQLFVDKFMVWLATQKNVQSPIAIFCSKIKEFAEEGDSAVMQCLSKKELLLEKELRAQAEQLQIAQQMADKYRNEVASNALDEKFNTWISSLTDQDKLKFVPESNWAKLGSGAHNGALRAYFVENLSNQEL